MRLIGLTATTLFLLANQACFIHVHDTNWSENSEDRDLNDPFADDEWDVAPEQPANELADDEEDKIEDTLDVVIDLGTDQLAGGEAAILDVTIEGEVSAADLEDVWFSDAVDVLDVLVRDDGVFIAVTVDVDVTGWVDVVFDFGALGEATTEIEIVDPAQLDAGDEGDADHGDDGSAGGDADGGYGDGEDPCD